jgi:homocysteine S-methyltransferase
MVDVLVPGGEAANRSSRLPGRVFDSRELRPGCGKLRGMSAPASRPSLRELLAGDRAVVLDGALATELEAAGHDLSDALWSARLLADDPAAIEAVHAAYLEAGAQVVITASYQASAEGFAALGLGASQAAELLQRSVRLAQRARERAGAHGALVAASVGPYGALLAGGQEYSGDYGAITDRELEDVHERRLRALLAADPDCVACETIPRVDEAAVLARVLDRLGAPDSWMSFSCRDGRTTVHGEPIEEAVAAAALSPRVVAVGVNCTAPEHVQELLARAATATDLPLVAYPNSGRTWDAATRAFGGDGAAALPAGAVRSWVAAGARLVGGCCGLGPDAVRGVARAVRAA